MKKETFISLTAFNKSISLLSLTIGIVLIASTDWKIFIGVSLIAFYFTLKLGRWTNIIHETLSNFIELHEKQAKELRRVIERLNNAMSCMKQLHPEIMFVNMETGEKIEDKDLPTANDEIH